MDRLEAQEQLRTLEEITKVYGVEHQFTSKDICQIHKIWLDKIYEWAGEYRVVNISKDGFSFSMAREIQKLMDDFGENILSQYTPCRYSSRKEIAEALAIIHVELVLIHPFRDGNGRLARLFAILMALQAGLPVLDFGGIYGRKKKEYIMAVQAGLGRNYQPMVKIFLSIIKRTFKNTILKSS